MTNNKPFWQCWPLKERRVQHRRDYSLSAVLCYPVLYNCALLDYKLEFFCSSDWACFIHTSLWSSFSALHLFIPFIQSFHVFYTFIASLFIHKLTLTLLSFLFILEAPTITSLQPTTRGLNTPRQTRLRCHPTECSDRICFGFNPGMSVSLHQSLNESR